MMGGMLVVVLCICYCCHKRVQKSEFSGEASDQWLQTSEDSDSNLQVFTVDSQQCYEVEGVFVDEPSPHPSPPPSYHDVMGLQDQRKTMDSDLPSYEDALRLQAHRLPPPPPPPRPNEQFYTIYMDQLTYI